MKSYVVCSLVLFQIVSIYGASELTQKRDGYVEFQSNESKGGDTFVMDVSFAPSHYILDWADLADGANQTVRAIALIALQSSQTEQREIISEQLEPFFSSVAVPLLRQLKVALEDDSLFGCRYTVEYLKPQDAALLKQAKALALRLECADLNGSVHVCYSVAYPTLLHVSYGLRDWYSSLHLSRGMPFSMGSPDLEVAQSGVEHTQQAEADLHMLIFHRNSPEVLQGQ